MLTEQYRLKKMKDFEILFAEGRFVSGNILSAKVWKIDPAKYPKRGYVENDLKIGFVASVKHEKKAVGRNRVKRQMREVVRLLLKDNRIKEGYFIAFLSTPKLFSAEYADIAQDIESILKKARLLI
ncbi:MAG: ribonuclease P protein component [Candidatus Magasanikbacteria bacterium]|nr:ribonuclease P protein component [Candidatus Magasanikbacteria bacterium]